jgi:hypothetical protein
MTSSGVVADGEYRSQLLIYSGCAMPVASRHVAPAAVHPCPGRLTSTMLLRALSVLLLLPFIYALTPHEELVKLAKSSPNGIIKLNDKTYDLITGPKRTWSASIQYTALDPRRRCNPCRFV